MKGSVMKKSKIFIVMQCILILIFSAAIFELSSPVFSFKEDEKGTCTMINDEKYYFVERWRYITLKERIGFLEDQPKFGKMFYMFFQQGIYSIDGDIHNNFYQPINILQDKDYNLLVSEKIWNDLKYIGDCSKMEYDRKIYTDRELIKAIIDLYNSENQDDGVPSSPAAETLLKLYFDQYPGVYYCLSIYESDYNHKYYLQLKNESYADLTDLFSLL